MITKKYAVWFKDTDPDTGNISQDGIIALCDSESNAKWVLSAIVSDWYSPSGANDPNRDFYIEELNRHVAS